MVYTCCQPVRSAQTHFKPIELLPCMGLSGDQSAAMASFKQKTEVALDMDGLNSRVFYLGLTMSHLYVFPRIQCHIHDPLPDLQL